MWEEAQGFPSSVMPPSLHLHVFTQKLLGVFPLGLLRRFWSKSMIGHGKLSSVSRPSPHPGGVEAGPESSNTNHVVGSSSSQLPSLGDLRAFKSHPINIKQGIFSTLSLENFKGFWSCEAGTLDKHQLRSIFWSSE